MNLYSKDKNLNFIQDIPYSVKDKRKIKLKYKNHFYSIWPSFYPTSTISVRKEFFFKIFKELSVDLSSNIRISFFYNFELNMT